MSTPDTDSRASWISRAMRRGGAARATPMGQVMRDRSQYFAVRCESSDTELLCDWRWLIGDSRYAIERVTATGSLFVRDDLNAIHFLDVTDGVFRRVANSPEELDALFEITDNRRNLLWSFFVRHLRNDGVHLAPGQCYGWKVPPCAGGEPEFHNAEPVELVGYLSFTGQLHRQLKSLPTGSSIDDVRLKVPRRPLWRRLLG